MALKLTNYDIDEEVLGKGAFGTVYSGTKKDIGQKVALKEIPKEVLNDKETQASIENEIIICSNLESRNIVKMLDIVDEGEKKYIAYELCNGGDLRKYMKFFERFNESFIQRIMIQMLNGLEELHRKKVIHHDIKPENILIQIFYNEKILSPKSEEKIKKIKEFIKKKPKPVTNRGNDQNTNNINQNNYNNITPYLNNNYINNNINFNQPIFNNNYNNTNMVNNNYNNYNYMNNNQITYYQNPNRIYPNNINNITSPNYIQNNNINNPYPYFRICNNNYHELNRRSCTPFYSTGQNHNNNIYYYQNNYYNNNNNMNNQYFNVRNSIYNINMNNINNVNNVNNYNLNNLNLNRYTSYMINNNYNMNNINKYNTNRNNRNKNNNNMKMNNMNNNNNGMNNMNSNNINNNGNNNMNNNSNINVSNSNKKDDNNDLNPKKDELTKEKILEILKEETEYKLSDFGLSKITNEIYKRNLSGSPLYMSPELFNPSSKIIAIENYKVDIWALGVLAFELYFGRRPFEAFSIEELSNMYKKGDYYINLDGKISKEFFCFLNRCLQRDPSKRADINELKNSNFINQDEETFNMLDKNELLESLGKLGKVDKNNNIVLKTYEIYFEDEC